MDGHDGEFPASLKALAPEILDEVPVDRCSGQGFVHRRSDDGYVLDSLGLNLTDDGGASDDDDPQGDELELRVSGTE